MFCNPDFSPVQPAAMHPAEDVIDELVRNHGTLDISNAVCECDLLQINSSFPAKV